MRPAGYCGDWHTRTALCSRSSNSDLPLSFLGSQRKTVTVYASLRRCSCWRDYCFRLVSFWAESHCTVGIRVQGFFWRRLEPSRFSSLCFERLGRSRSEEIRTLEKRPQETASRNGLEPYSSPHLRGLFTTRPGPSIQIRSNELYGSLGLLEVNWFRFCKKAFQFSPCR